MVIKMRGAEKRFFFGIVFFLVVFVGILFVMADSYDVAPSTTQAGNIVSLLKFNVSNTTVPANYSNFTNVTIAIIGTASSGINNVTNVTISDGTNTYYNDSFTVSPVVIILNHNFSTTTSVNWTVNFTLNSSATWNVTIGANVTNIGNITADNLSYSALPYNSSLTLINESTAPTASATCSPTTVQTGDSFPCTCSGTDSGATASGVSTSTGSSNSPDGVSRPVNTGTFTYTCTVIDNAGNTASTTATYTITQPPSSGSSSTTTTWITHILTESVLEKGYTTELGINNRIKTQIYSEDHYISVLSISGSKATIEISSNPTQVTLAAGGNTKLDVTGDGFYDVYVLLNGIMNNKASITIQKIHEVIPEGSTGIETTTGTSTGENAEKGKTQGQGSLTWLWVLIIGIVLFLLWFRATNPRKR